MSEDRTSLFTIVKIVVITAGVIYLAQLLTWLAHWGIMAAAIGGVGYLAYRVGASLGDEKTPRQLTDDRQFQDRLHRLESEERQLDRELGLR